MPDITNNQPRPGATPADSQADHHAAANGHARIVPDLEQILDALQDAVLLVDHAWRITYANQNAFRISRLEPGDLHRKTLWEVYPRLVGTELERKFRQSMETREHDEHVFFYGPYQIWVQMRMVPVPDGLCLIYRDITGEKREELGRVALAQQLEQVLEVTTDGVVYLDRDYNFTFLNRRARELLSPSGDPLRTSLWQTFPSTTDERLPFAANYRRSMEQGLPADFEVFYPEPLNKWFSIHTRPAENGIILFFRDVTEDRRASEDLRLERKEAERQKAEIEAVYRTAPVGLALFDPVEFRYLRLNDRQANFFGLKPEQVLGRTLTEMAPIPGLREMFEQVARGEPVLDQLLEGELVTHPGERRYWTVNYAPVFAPDGNVQAISAVSLEITRQKLAEAALIQSEKLAAVGRLATSISHEINNPLESVTNLLYLIAHHPSLPDELREYTHLAEAELARVSQIATQTLRFHRQSMKPNLVTAPALVDAVIALYQGRLANSGIEVEARYATQAPFLCFENDMRQVLNNLLSNAIDAMRTGGRLLIRAHETADHRTQVPSNSESVSPDAPVRGVRITVADTGHGMSPATRARIFEPFYTTKDLSGNGLGLWISSEIVGRHGGRLTLRSSQDPAHRGTVFTLFLPFTVLRQELSTPVPILGASEPC